jgi:hypothetical protein
MKKPLTYDGYCRDHSRCDFGVSFKFRKERKKQKIVNIVKIDPAQAIQKEKETATAK